MGYMRHHAIIVTSWNEELLPKAHIKALETFHHLGAVTPITAETMNGYASFLIAPDGSKEGWEDSDYGDKARKVFKHWLNLQRYEDGSTSLDWVEVQFGDDEKETKIINHSDEDNI